MLPDYAELALNTVKIIFNFAQSALPVICPGSRRRGRACLEEGMESFIIIEVVVLRLLALRDSVGRVATHKRYWPHVFFSHRMIQIFMPMLELRATRKHVNVLRAVVSNWRCML